VATIHISEAEALRDLPGLLAHVRAGGEVVIENGVAPPVVLRPASSTMRRTIEDCLLSLAPDSTATMDEDFASDVAAAVDAHRQPLNPPAWK
jgi:antitoxin (DNA-binding transcriptional repressor) of toxin-antitoxin stability system